MKYINTKNIKEKASFKQAVVQGLARNKGLFMPEMIPVLDASFFSQMLDLSDIEIASKVLYPFAKESIEWSDFQSILKKTLVFPIPLVPVAPDVYALELYHGPTKAFKDLGARFMATCLSHFTDTKQKVTVLVATSGDTGSAVAHGFYQVDGVEVAILYPKGKVSPYQEHQMTSLQGNIRAIEVDGTFDDCQTLVKEAFADEFLNKEMKLSSANSINVARLLPQMLFYFFAWKQIRKLTENPIVISVPSGNFGNLTAGIIARKMGLPIKRFIAANNANDTFHLYLKSGQYLPKSSCSTYSNAMDVGAPSNFERLMHLFDGDHNAIQNKIHSYSIDDKQTLGEIREVFQRNNYTLDPHGAVGKICLDKDLTKHETGIFFETAHPQKFGNIVRMAIPDLPDNKVDLSACKKTSIGNNYCEFFDLLVP
ncbi:MAG: threonine synthase [Bacteroidetes bacterium]|nr:threonine synthase [Bacteroidota bacterium]